MLQCVNRRMPGYVGQVGGIAPSQTAGRRQDKERYGIFRCCGVRRVHLTQRQNRGELDIRRILVQDRSEPLDRGISEEGTNTERLSKVFFNLGNDGECRKGVTTRCEEVFGYAEL